MKLSEWFKIRFAKCSPSADMAKMGLPTLWEMLAHNIRVWVNIRRWYEKDAVEEYISMQESTIESRLPVETVRRLREIK